MECDWERNFHHSLIYRRTHTILDYSVCSLSFSLYLTQYIDKWIVNDTIAQYGNVRMHRQSNFLAYSLWVYSIAACVILFEQRWLFFFISCVDFDWLNVKQEKKCITRATCGFETSRTSPHQNKNGISLLLFSLFWNHIHSLTWIAHILFTGGILNVHFDFSWGQWTFQHGNVQ